MLNSSPETPWSNREVMIMDCSTTKRLISNQLLVCLSYQCRTLSLSNRDSVWRQQLLNWTRECERKPPPIWSSRRSLRIGSRRSSTQRWKNQCDNFESLFTSLLTPWQSHRLSYMVSGIALLIHGGCVISDGYASQNCDSPALIG